MGVIQYLNDFFQAIWLFVIKINFFDVLDILMLAFIIYMIIKFTKETRAEQLLKGISFLILLFLLIKQFNQQLKVMNFILENFFQVGIIALIIMFQPELRRILEKMGRSSVSNIALSFENQNITDELLINMIKQVTEACARFSKSKTGALIAIERQTGLGEQIDTGTILKSEVSTELLGNIFFPNTPLHDGAVIIRNGLIHAAGCFLPKPQKEQLISKDLGSRHRAAIGLSEISDAIIIAVSEETGTISVAENGSLARGFNAESLKELLYTKLLSDQNYRRRKSRKKQFSKSNQNTDNKQNDSQDNSTPKA